MKKRFSILIALVLVLAAALPVLASCVTDKVVKSIKVVSPKTEYKVNETIDYDNLQVEVTYEDNTTAKKTVKELKATVIKADLTKAGSTSYTVTYSGKSDTVNLTVSAEPVEDIKNFQAQTFVEPDFYTNYKTKSADRGDKPEGRGDFRITGEVYEVGNVNKFVYRPTATGLDLEQHKTVTLTNVKTTVKVYSKDTKDGTYAEVTGDSIANLVAIEDNTYKFTEQAAGKYVKLEISIDAEEYDVENIEEENRTLTVEFEVVDGGYNVYDQMGLSAMCDIAKNAWADLWGCQSTWNSEQSTYVLSEKAGVTPVKLDADDKPLYQYVDNISWVILHSNIVLNADQMPAMYFWNSADDEGYTVAYDSLSGLADMQAKLLGSLNDGRNNDYYYRVTDIIPGTDGQAADLNFGHSINMQKGLFLTKKVSVSGNYNSITVPEEKSEGGRTFLTIADWDKGTKKTDPTPHHSIFLMYTAHNGEGVMVDTGFEIKNVSMSGNSAKQDIGEGESAKGVPAGMMMSLCYSKDMTYNNVVADKFFTNIVVDGYSDDTGVKIENSKLYDSYSNMCYMWRSNISITNSEMIGSGGPLFILCDGDTHFVTDTSLTDANGSQLTVDKSSVLQAYATGNESWYAIYNAQPIVNQFKTMLEPGMNALGKTIITKQHGSDYLNLIAAIICSPGDLLAGKSDGMMDVCGSFVTMDGENVVEQFNMHNTYLTTLRAAGLANENNQGAKNFPVIMQLGNNFAYTKGDGKMYTLSPSGEHEMAGADFLPWMQANNNRLCVYLSAQGTANAPYFAAIVEINPLQQAAD